MKGNDFCFSNMTNNSVSGSLFCISAPRKGIFFNNFLLTKSIVFSNSVPTKGFHLHAEPMYTKPSGMPPCRRGGGVFVVSVSLCCLCFKVFDTGGNCI